MPEITVAQAEMVGRLQTGAAGELPGINAYRAERGLPKLQLCAKCGGAGVFTCWAHIEAGVCFACRGARFMTDAQVAGYYRGVERAAARAAHADFRRGQRPGVGRDDDTCPHGVMIWKTGDCEQCEPPARRERRPVARVARPVTARPVQVAPGSRWSDAEWDALNRGR